MVMFMVGQLTEKPQDYQQQPGKARVNQTVAMLNGTTDFIIQLH